MGWLGDEMLGVAGFGVVQGVRLGVWIVRSAGCVVSAGPDWVLASSGVRAGLAGVIGLVVGERRALRRWWGAPGCG